MGRVTVIETNLDFEPLTPREKTTAIVIHHTGADLDPDAATIHDWHKQNGWNGCGYHFIIRKDGSIECGRPKWSVGSHAYGRNIDTIGVHVGGEFTHNPPTDAQIESLVALLADLCEEYGLDPAAAIIGHRDTPTPTACPGDVLYGILPEVRVAVANIMGDGRYNNERDVVKKAIEKAHEMGHSIDDGVENSALKHNMPKWKVWMWYGVAALGFVGVAKLLGWL